jgi:glycosyltransferase involved in cell wall biosynthesis
MKIKLDAKDRALKNCIFITPYFPPIGGVAVQRILKFIKYLPEFGWHSIVLSPPIWSLKKHWDRSMLKEIPKDTEVYHPLFFNYRRFLPGEINKQLKKLKKSNFPDDYILWIPFVMKRIDSLIAKKQIHLIYITVPSFSLLSLVKKIKEKHGIPVIVDFRDPYSFNIYNTWKHACKINPNILMLEHSAISEADKIFSVSKHIVERYQSIYTEFSGKFALMCNGYDNEDFNFHIPDVNKLPHKHLTLCFNGSPSQLVPLKPIVEAIVEIYEKHSIQIHLIISTIVSRQHVNRECKKLLEYGLLHYHGFLPHKLSIRALPNSHVLLMMLVKGNGTQGILSAKIFEYMRAERPILLLHDESSELAEIIHDTHTGITIDIDNPNEIVDALLNLNRQFMSKQIKICPKWDEIDKYEAKNRTELLAEYFDSLLQ